MSLPRNSVVSPLLKKLHTPGRRADLLGTVVWSGRRDRPDRGHIRREAGDFGFRGLLLDATLAETTSGWNAVLGRIAELSSADQAEGPSCPSGFRVPWNNRNLALMFVVRSVPARHERQARRPNRHCA